MKQKTKLKKLDIRTKGITDILKAEGIVDPNMPSRGILEVKSRCIFDQSRFTWVLSSVRPRVCDSVSHQLGRRRSGCRRRSRPIRDAHVSTVLFRGSLHSRDQYPSFPQLWHKPILGPPPSCLIGARTSASVHQRRPYASGDLMPGPMLEYLA
jgi:hypothetical protein